MEHTQNTARKSCYLAGQLLLKPWRNKKPRTHVLRLLLTPDKIYKRRNFISVQQVMYIQHTTHTKRHNMYVCVHTIQAIYICIYTHMYIDTYLQTHTYILIHTFLIWDSVCFFEKCIVIYPSPSPHHHNDTEQSSLSQISPHSVAYTQLFLHLQPPAITDLFSIHKVLPFPDQADKWNHTASLLGLASVN